MESLQMLKFWLKKDCLNFTKGWITSQKDMVFDEDNNDLLALLFSTTNASSLDNVLGAIARVEGDEVSSNMDILHSWHIMYYMLQLACGEVGHSPSVVRWF